MEYVLARGPAADVMAEIDRYRADDRRVVDALYRRVFGHDAAEASRLRWDWQYRRNPNNPRRRARDLDRARRAGDRRPVRHHAGAGVGRRAARCGARGAWTSWWRPNGSARGLARCCSARGTATSAPRSAWACRSRRTGCSRSCAGRTSGPLPCLVKPLTRRALRRPDLAGRRQPPRLGRHAADRQGRRADAAARRRGAAHPALRRQLHRALGTRWRRSSTSPSGATPPT